MDDGLVHEQGDIGLVIRGTVPGNDHAVANILDARHRDDEALILVDVPLVIGLGQLLDGQPKVIREVLGGNPHGFANLDQVEHVIHHSLLCKH